MKQVLTVACKIEVPEEVAPKIDATLIAFASACNYINQTVPPYITNNVRIQTLTYQDVRNQFGLSANLAVRAINRVAGNRKTAQKAGKPVKEFKPTSADYDSRIFSFREQDWTVSLNLIGGRERFKLLIGNYQLGLLKGQQPTSATLVKRRDGSYYVHIQIKKDSPKLPKNKDVLGVDLGRTDIAVSSTGEKFSGEKINKIRDHYSTVRASIQKKATLMPRSTRRRARRLLKRLSGKERRFQAHVNHNVSKQLVSIAKELNLVIALEDLTGIRERTNEQPRSKTERRRSNNWAFYQLRMFVVYKAVLSGVRVVFVPPAYTSQTCHQCLHIHPLQGKSYRNGKLFKCGHCGWKGDADHNGSMNIASLGVVYVNRPRGPGLVCSKDRDDSGLLKAHAIPLCG